MLKFDLVPIEPGSFVMGNRQAIAKDEKKEVAIEITRPFKMLRTPVTQKEWKSVIASKPWSIDEVRSDDGFKEGPSFPVVGVSRADIDTFLRELKKKTKINCQLPTEAQWEYAIRAGTNTQYFWGSDYTQVSQYAWCWNEGSLDACHLREVGLLKPNPWGLYDMAGNICEWIRDKCDVEKGSPYIQRWHYPKKATDFYSKKGAYGILKNGSFRCPVGCLKSSYKRTRRLDDIDVINGFRFVVDE